MIQSLFKSMITCKKCGFEKPLFAFYVSNLTVCKDCVKAAVRAHREILLNDPSWRVKERERCRLKQDRFRREMTPEQAEKAKEQHERANKKWRESNREKRRAHEVANNAVRDGSLSPKTQCEKCGEFGELEKHHPDHLKPLDVQWLCLRCHAETRRLGDAPIRRRIAA